MASRQSSAPPRSVAFDLLGLFLLGIAGAPFLPWGEAGRGQTLNLFQRGTGSTGAVGVAVVVVAVIAFLAFAQYIAASGLGLVAGLLAVLFGLNAVLGADTASFDTKGELKTSIGPWVVLIAGVGAIISSVVAFFVAARRERY